jgi:hypothetical protein
LIDHFDLSLRLDDHLECFGLGGAAEGLVGIEDLIKLEATRDEAFGIDLLSPDKRCFSSDRQGLFNAPLVSSSDEARFVRGFALVDKPMRCSDCFRMDLARRCRPCQRPWPDIAPWSRNYSLAFRKC